MERRDFLQERRRRLDIFFPQPAVSHHQLGTLCRTLIARLLAKQQSSNCFKRRCAVSQIGPQDIPGRGQWGLGDLVRTGRKKRLATSLRPSMNQDDAWLTSPGPPATAAYPGMEAYDPVGPCSPAFRSVPGPVRHCASCLSPEVPQGNFLSQGIYGSILVKNSPIQYQRRTEKRPWSWASFL